MAIFQTRKSSQLGRGVSSRVPRTSMSEPVKAKQRPRGHRRSCPRHGLAAQCRGRTRAVRTAHAGLTATTRSGVLPEPGSRARRARIPASAGSASVEVARNTCEETSTEIAKKPLGQWPRLGTPSGVCCPADDRDWSVGVVGARALDTGCLDRDRAVRHEMRSEVGGALGATSESSPPRGSKPLLQPRRHAGQGVAA